MARCPKCRCGELVEIGRRMVCLNCDYTCSRAHARLLQDSSHTHSKVSCAKELQTPRRAAGRFAPPNGAAPAARGKSPLPAPVPSVNSGKAKSRLIAILVFLFVIALAIVAFGWMDSCAVEQGLYPGFR